MKDLVRLLNPAPSELWDRLARESAEATFFHTRAWAETLAATFPDLRIATRAYAFADGTTAVLPLLERSRLGGLLRTYESVTPGLYGGPIADGPLSEAQVEAIVRDVLTPGVARFRIHANPFAEARLPASLPRQPEFTQALDLSRGVDAVVAGFNRGARSALHKAQRSGLEVCLAETDAGYRAYYGAYEDSLRRWGKRAMAHYPFELFTNIRDRGSENVKLWLVKKDGEVAAGAYVFYHNQHAVYWHGAMAERFSELRPTNLLHFEIIRDACQRGYRWYDFNPSGPNEGVVRFKDSFGAQRLYYDPRRAQRQPLIGLASLASDALKRAGGAPDVLLTLA